MYCNALSIIIGRAVMSYNDAINEILQLYHSTIWGMEGRAREIAKKEGRAYGGVLRSFKGELVESIAKHMTKLAWEKLGGKEYRLAFKRTGIKLSIDREYINKITNKNVRNFLVKNVERYYYRLPPDVLVYIDRTLVASIECKAYAENAMLKRILVDFTITKKIYPNIIPILIQLESQLGGDYSELKPSALTFGSPSTHTLLSLFDVDLNIITLLKGERRIDKPIHKKEFYKPLSRNSLENAITVISGLLKKYLAKQTFF